MDKRVSWQYMVEHYPNMWIAVKDAEMDGPDIVSGMVYAVIADNEIIEYENEHRKDGLTFRRTKGGFSNGPIRANFIVETA